jgi:hypothetical protein
MRASHGLALGTALPDSVGENPLRVNMDQQRGEYSNVVDPLGGADTTGRFWCITPARLFRLDSRPGLRDIGR